MSAPQIKSIASRENPLLVRLRKLAADPAAYRKLGEVWIEGEHLCSAFAHRGGVAAQAVITAEGWQTPALRAIAGTAASVAVIPAALMAGLSTLESPAPLGFALPWIGAGELDGQAPSIVLDRLQDAGNVGNILRSASAFGFTQVVAIKGTAALWSPKVLRAGMGAHFALKLVEVAERRRRWPHCKCRCSRPVRTRSRAIHEAPLPWPCAWVMGHEGQGVSPALTLRCAESLRIPQPGGEESLNVAAAAAVCLYESARQRG